MTAGSTSGNTPLYDIAEVLDKIRVFVDVPQAASMGNRERDAGSRDIRLHAGQRPAFLKRAAVARTSESIDPSGAHAQKVEVDIDNPDLCRSPW